MAWTTMYVEFWTSVVLLLPTVAVRTELRLGPVAKEETDEGASSRSEDGQA